MEKEAIHCPGPEHVSHKKTLIFKGDNELFAYCKVHGWVSIKFSVAGKPISFKGAAIEIGPAKWKHIKNVEAPTLSVGRFKRHDNSVNP